MLKILRQQRNGAGQNNNIIAAVAPVACAVACFQRDIDDAVRGQFCAAARLDSGKISTLQTC
jgi:hypothetical protein